MPLNRRRIALHPHIIAVMEEMDTEDPFDAVRKKALGVAEQYYQLFSEPPPFNMKALASVRGLRWSDDDPRYSADSEIAPEADGRVVLRVNKSRPLGRQRFSIGHEVGHTLFPEYETAVRCRMALDRSWADSGDLLETLCDVAASELVFPQPWFSDRVSTLSLSAVSLALLATDYQASRDATVRRYVELSEEPLAAVFLRWKLKPTESRSVNRNRLQTTLLPNFRRGAPKPLLRVDYAILNKRFEAECADHIPKDKSVPSDGPIFVASMTQSLQDGRSKLDFGTVQGTFSAFVLPVFTTEEAMGPDGGCAVVAVLRPV